MTIKESFYRSCDKYLKDCQLRILLVIGIVSAPLANAKLVEDSIYSETMKKEINFAVEIPAGAFFTPNRIYPVLYGLHGMNGNRQAWVVMTQLITAINIDYPAVVVSFDALNSWYVNSVSDPTSQYTTFFFDELVPYVEAHYPVGKTPDMRGVTGFSMGGFGAWHYMLERPDFFSSVSSLSGAFGRTPGGNANPYDRITDRALAGGSLPPTYIGCGTSDGLLYDSKNMNTHLKEKGYSVVYVETPNAIHDWSYWNAVSDDLLAWHYQYMSGPIDTNLWKNLPVLPTGDVDTGSSLGWLNTKSDPWIWSYSLSGWTYFAESWSVEYGGWIWIPR